MPTSKTFEQTIRFHQFGPVRVPMVTVTLIQSNGNRISLPLLFDTGASTTTLRHDLYPLLELTSWDEGQQVQALTAGGAQPVD